MSNSRSYIFFLLFPLIAVKLGHFTINEIFLYVTNTQAYQRRTEKFFLGSAIKSQFAEGKMNINITLENEEKFEEINPIKADIPRTD